MSFEIIADGLTHVSWLPASTGEPVDLTPHVTSMRMELVNEPPVPVFACEWLKPIRFKGKLRMTPLGHRALFGRTHPRLRRMHAAYGRRRGRGRW